MSDIYRRAVTARAQLTCDATGCGKRWESALYEPRRFGDDEKAAAPAFTMGWRLFAASRGRRTYCPKHGPKTPMYEVHGPGVTR